jgi:uncharacterized protein DUF3592
MEHEENGMFGASEDQIQSTRELSLREINARIPRKVRPSAETKTALKPALFVFGVLVVLTVWYVHSKVQEERHIEAVSREGLDAPARVTKVLHGRHGSSVYYSFRFGGAVYQGEVNSDDMIWDAHVGENIPIRFLPSDPSVNHPTPWSLWVWSDFVFVTFLLVSFGAAAKLAVFLYLERRLARLGWVTDGEVIACAPKGSRFRVDYEFFDENHTQFDGANEDSDEYKTGSSIRVIYLRTNPKRNDTYPMSSYQTAD